MRVKSRIERLAEELLDLSKSGCETMPQMLTDRQLDLLRIVVHVGRDGVTAMARALGVAQPTLTELVNPLVQSGILEKRRAQEGSEAETRFGGSQVFLTKKGASVLARMESANIEIEDCVLGALSDKEKEVLLDLLEKVISQHPVNSQYIAAVNAKAAGVTR